MLRSLEGSIVSLFISYHQMKAWHWMEALISGKNGMHNCFKEYLFQIKTQQAKPDKETSDNLVFGRR